MSKSARLCCYTASTNIPASFLLLLIGAVVVSKWYGSMETSAPPFKSYFTSKTRLNVTLESLHVKIWDEIRSLQEDGICEEKKILYCENVGNYAGFGSMMMRYGVCVQIAYALGRTFFIEQRQYKHFGGIFRFLQNDSNRCGYLKHSNELSNIACNLHDRWCYLKNGFDVNNSYKVLRFHASKKFPAPRTVPGSIPLEIEQQLVRLGIEEPWLWFTSQFLGYLMLRLKPEVMDLMNSFIKNMDYTYPLVSMHIRRGDKLKGEAKYVKENKYLSVADRYFKTVLPNNTKHKIFLASDDRNIMSKLQSIRLNYTFCQIPRQYVKNILKPGMYFATMFPKEVIESIIIELNLLAYANYTVCTFSSNICRLVWSLKAALPPYRAENRIFSMDQSRKLNFYHWYGYVFPLIKYWVPTRTSSTIVTFPDGFKSMQYETGMLFEEKSGEKTFRVNNVNYTVLYASTVWWENGTKEGYVFKDDVVRWPGRPSYHFYN